MLDSYLKVTNTENQLEKNYKKRILLIFNFKL